MTNQNMWHIPDVSNIQTPVSMMRAQADILTNLTDGLLIGSVDAAGSGPDIKYEFKITVPNLSRYVFSVLLYNQKITSIFVGSMYVYATQKRYHVAGQESFRQALSEVLSSEEITDVIGSLLAQARG